MNNSGRKFDNRLNYTKTFLTSGKTKKQNTDVYSTIKIAFTKGLIKISDAIRVFDNIGFNRSNSNKYKKGINEYLEIKNDIEDIKPIYESVINFNENNIKNQTIKVDNEQLDVNFFIHKQQIKKAMEIGGYVIHDVIYSDGRHIKFDFPYKLGSKAILNKIQFELMDISSGTWYVRNFLEYFDEPNFVSENRKVKIITKVFKRITNHDKEVIMRQRFRFNNSNDCVYKAMVSFFEKYIDSKNFNALSIYKKLTTQVKKYSKPYTIPEMEELFKSFKIGATIVDIVNKNNININHSSYNRFHIDFINTKYNHLDLFKSMNNKVEEVSSYDYDQLKLKSNYYMEKYNTLHTIDGTYKVIDDRFKTIFKKWKLDNDIATMSIPIKSDCYKFIESYDDKVHRMFNDALEIDNELYEELDLKKAYYNYHKCNQYIGIPSGSYICVSGDGFTTELFNEQYNNKLVGFYEVIIKHDNEKLNYYGLTLGSKHVLFSSMIKLLIPYCEFEFINYCVSPSVDIKFGKEFLERDDDESPRYYCKAVGCMMISNSENIIKIKPNDNDNEFYKTLLSNNIYKVKNEFHVIEELNDPKSLKHISLSIHAYSSTIIMEQLLKMNHNDVFGVKVDSIIYKCNSKFDYDKKLFSDPEVSNIMTLLNNIDGNTYKKEYYKTYFIKSSNEIAFDKTFLPNGEHIIKPIIYLGGAGGCGKTHSLLSSKNFIKSGLLYTSSCWELIQDKMKEFGINGLSLPKLTGEINGAKCEKVNIISSKYEIYDEMTLISKSIIEKRIKENKNFIFLIGDVDHHRFYQCSIGGDVYYPNASTQYIKYTKSYRFDDELNEKIQEVRRIMCRYSENDYCEYLRLFKDNIRDEKDVIINEDDIGISCLKPIDENGNCKLSHIFYKNGSNKQYYIKNTNLKTYEYRGAKIEGEPKNKNYTCSLFRTIHSFQGRQLNHDNKIIIYINSLFDKCLFYTAVSRARRLDQIIIINKTKWSI